MNTLETKLKDLKKGEVLHNRYVIFFLEYPFKSLRIAPKIHDKESLFEFSCMENRGTEWHCGMVKTSYYQTRLYEGRFDDTDSIQTVLEFVDETLIHLRDTLNENFKQTK